MSSNQGNIGTTTIPTNTLPENLCWTVWPASRARRKDGSPAFVTRGGEGFEGPFGSLCRAIRRNGDLDGGIVEKAAGKTWAPVKNPTGQRAAKHVHTIHALVLDSDTGHEWDTLRDRLNDLGLAYCLYQSPSYTPETPKWRAVIPLSRPFATFGDGSQNRAWNRTYEYCRILFGNLAGFSDPISEGFDAATKSAGNIFFFGTRSDLSMPYREVVCQADGLALDTDAIIFRIDDPTRQENDTRPPRDQIVRTMTDRKRALGPSQDLSPDTIIELTERGETVVRVSAENLAAHLNGSKHHCHCPSGAHESRGYGAAYAIGVSDRLAMVNCVTCDGRWKAWAAEEIPDGLGLWDGGTEPQEALLDLGVGEDASEVDMGPPEPVAAYPEPVAISVGHSHMATVGLAESLYPAYCDWLQSQGWQRPTERCGFDQLLETTNRVGVVWRQCRSRACLPCAAKRLSLLTAAIAGGRFIGRGEWGQCVGLPLCQRETVWVGRITSLAGFKSAWKRAKEEVTLFSSYGNSTPFMLRRKEGHFLLSSGQEVEDTGLPANLLPEPPSGCRWVTSDVAGWAVFSLPSGEQWAISSSPAGIRDAKQLEGEAVVEEVIRLVRDSHPVVFPTPQGVVKAIGFGDALSDDPHIPVRAVTTSWGIVTDPQSLTTASETTWKARRERVSLTAAKQVIRGHMLTPEEGRTQWDEHAEKDREDPDREEAPAVFVGSPKVSAEQKDSILSQLIRIDVLNALVDPDHRDRAAEDDVDLEDMIRDAETKAVATPIVEIDLSAAASCFGATVEQYRDQTEALNAFADSL